MAKYEINQPAPIHQDKEQQIELLKTNIEFHEDFIKSHPGPLPKDMVEFYQEMKTELQELQKEYKLDFIKPDSVLLKQASSLLLSDMDPHQAIELIDQVKHQVKAPQQETDLSR